VRIEGIPSFSIGAVLCSQSIIASHRKPSVSTSEVKT